MTRVIQIGVGHFGRAWREALTTTPEVQVVGLVDIRTNELKEGAAFFNVPQARCFDDAYGDWPDVEADLVIDSTPHMFHYENAIRAFRSGKDVIVVKPMSDRWEGARTMVREAQRWGRKLVVAQQLRFHPLILTLRETLQKAPLGQIGMIHFDGCFGRRGPVRNKWHQPYPLLVEGAIHHLDLIRWCTGEDAVSVYAETWNAPWNDEVLGLQNAYAIFEMESGARLCYRGVCTAEHEADWTGHWFIEGEKGIIRKDNKDVYLNGQKVPLAKGQGEDLQGLPLARFNAQVFRQALDYFQGGEEPLISGRNNLGSINMVFGAVQSAETGRRVSLHPDA